MPTTTLPRLSDLPAALRQLLLCASLGKNHLAHAGRLALEAALAEQGRQRVPDGRSGPAGTAETDGADQARDTAETGLSAGMSGSAGPEAPTKPQERSGPAAPADHADQAAPDSAGALTALARELFTAAWLSDPLDGVAAANLAGFEARLPGLAKPAARCLNTALALTSGHNVPARLRRLEEAGEYGALRDWLRAELSREAASGVLAWTLYSHALANGDPDAAMEACQGLARVAPLAPVVAGMRGDARLLAGECLPALAEYAAAEAAFPGHYTDRAAEALLRLGRRDEATRALDQLIQAAPWRVTAILRRYDLASGRDEAVARLDGRVAVLLYSYNNPERLAVTLESLAASDVSLAGEVIVRLLINGPNAEAEAVAEGFAGRFGQRFATVRLPVNVGAAPARNWLRSLPEVRACDYAAYLDDDVRLPSDWLGRFGAAVAAYPQAGLYGCRVADFGAVNALQQVDGHILPPRQGETLFSLCDAHLHAPDLGRFGYMRPCATVTGCCHLFRTEALLRSGEFDIRFSPTQYDDLDHDLRLGLLGIPIVYQGHLVVEHMKLSGKGLRLSRAASANAAANMYKLKSKYEDEELEGLRRGETEALRLDIVEKQKNFFVQHHE